MEVVATEEEERMHESISEVRRVLYPHRSFHFAEAGGRKSCERCRAMIRAFEAQLEKEEKAALPLITVHIEFPQECSSVKSYH
jgi:hypothetical protein